MEATHRPKTKEIKRELASTLAEVRSVDKKVSIRKTQIDRAGKSWPELIELSNEISIILAAAAPTKHRRRKH